MFRRANHRPSDKEVKEQETQTGKKKKERARAVMLRCRDRKRHHFLSGVKPVQKEEPKEDIKPHDSDLLK